jgi:hypothetical protein
VIALEIPRIHLGQNRMLRTHWAVRRKQQKSWTNEIWGEWMQLQGRPPTPLTYLAQVTVDRRTPRQLLDDDNVCAKFIMDGLKQAGIIFDDSPKYVRVILTQSRGKPRTRIEIQPI